MVRPRFTCSIRSDPIVEAYRRIFPSLFKDAAKMPSRTAPNTYATPELLLKLQAEVYGLYHMTDPARSTIVRICRPSPPKLA